MKTKITAEIIVVGNELLNGSTLETNSNFLEQKLDELGIAVSRVILVRDIEEEICEALRGHNPQSALILVTGGLGPTSDDLTREAIAKYFSLPLELSHESLERIKAHYTRRGRILDDNAIKQALFPKDASIIANPAGTADAFLIERSYEDTSSGRRSKLPFICLPGVPREVKVIFEDKLKNLLLERFTSVKATQRRYLRCFGLAESFIGSKIDALNLPSYVQISYRPQFPEILLTLATDENSTVLSEVAKSISSTLGEKFIINNNTKDLNISEIIAERLSKNNYTLAVAESCTGGKLADTIVLTPGASKYFNGGFITYNNDLKIKLLGVNALTLERHGAVSEEVAKEMAEGARIKTNSDFALAVTGIAGPEGGSEEKPIGTVCFALAHKTGSLTARDIAKFERNLFREFCSHFALNMLREHLE